ncbi:SE-domain-containing protein [Auricularia subglabra TFB-10046 SS5]|nr:SE-domain-containing protein [Auricularia subglabra TFB-10046 SS5]
MANSYDVILVGGGVAGCTMARALSMQHRRVCVLERSLAEPDRIVGELLQPAGMASLEKLGMADCTDGIGAVTCTGYCVIDARAGRQVHIPYNEGAGRSFHHGRFIQKLRARAAESDGVELVEGTVTEFVECDNTYRVLGVRASTTRSGKQTEVFLAPLVIVADGYASKFRSDVLGLERGDVTSVVKSHFVGVVLKDARLPFPGCGTVALVPGQGPVLMYQIEEGASHETRILVDVREPLPKDLRAHIQDSILPHLPSGVQQPLLDALTNDRLRRMPNSFMPSRMQGARPLAKEGVLLLGDAWNMRHPLTGGGMTVAFHDVLTLSEQLAPIADLHDWDAVLEAAHRWFWQRKRLAATVNVLSVALYDLFGAESDDLAVLRTGCFKYFELGGECVRGPVSLLAATRPSFVTLFLHFFAVAFYSLWVLFTHPRPVRTSAEGKPVLRRPRPDEWPFLIFRSLSVFWTACVVFLPVMWTEIKWW